MKISYNRGELNQYISQKLFTGSTDYHHTPNNQTSFIRKVKNYL